MKTKKIEKMTAAQEALVPVYRDKWLRNGWNTQPIDRAKAKESVEWLYARLGRPAPVLWWSDSPMQALLTGELLQSKNFGEALAKDLGANLGANLGDNLRANLGDNLWDNLGDNLRANLGDNLRANLGDNLRANLGDNLWDNLGDNLWDNLGANLWANLGDNLGANLKKSDLAWAKSNATNYHSDVWDTSYWVGFYDFILNELFKDRVSEFPEFVKYLDICQSLHLIYPFAGICFVVERPIALHAAEISNRFRLHREGGLALQYKDGYGIAALNGVRVPEWVATQAPQDLDGAEIMKLTNAEQRKEGIKRIGIDRMRDVLKVEVIDSFRDYELWTIEFEGRRIGPYLKMINPTTAQIHVEGVGEANGSVDGKIKTCRQALAWRGGFELFEEPLWTA